MRPTVDSPKAKELPAGETEDLELGHRIWNGEDHRQAQPDFDRKVDMDRTRPYFFIGKFARALD